MTCVNGTTLVTSQKVESSESHTQFDSAVVDEHIVCSLNQMFISIIYLYINVGGTKTKLKGIDFEQYIKQFDLVCLGETKLDRFDDIVIPGYKC